MKKFFTYISLSIMIFSFFYGQDCSILISLDELDGSVEIDISESISVPLSDILGVDIPSGCAPLSAFEAGSVDLSENTTSIFPYEPFDDIPLEINGIYVDGYVEIEVTNSLPFTIDNFQILFIDENGDNWINSQVQNVSSGFAIEDISVLENIFLPQTINVEVVMSYSVPTSNCEVDLGEGIYIDENAQLLFTYDFEITGGSVDAGGYMDNCGECVNGEYGLLPCEQDCMGTWGGDAVEDACGECSGSETDPSNCGSGILGCMNSGACNYDESATEDDGSCEYFDCTGECGGTVEVDECGECGGEDYFDEDGLLSDGSCDCEGSTFDCAGECGGFAVIDECGECGGDGIDEGLCDCDGNAFDCAGECGGLSVVDECGECGGDSSSCLDECGVPNGDNTTCLDDCGVVNGDNSSCSGCLMLAACNYDETVLIGDDSLCLFFDCTGDCGGTTEVDECGECGGDGIDEGFCDCDGNLPDCNGECGGSAVLDCTGVCEGNAVDDCAGVCGGDAAEDCAGICNGSTPIDCAGVCDGEAEIDCFGNCGGNAEIDCMGVCGGLAYLDSCDECWNAGGNILPPASVQNLSAESGLYYLRLSFNEGIIQGGNNYSGPENNSEGYEIYRDGVLVDNIQDNCQSEFYFIDNQLESATSYQYTVIAYNNIGDYGAESELSATTRNKPEGTVINPGAGSIHTPFESVSVDFSVTDSDLAQSVDAYYMDDDGGWQLLGSSSDGLSIDFTVPGIDDEIYDGASIKLIVSDTGDYFGNDSQATESVGHSFVVATPNQSIELGPGWHLIGVPVDPYDSNPEILFPETDMTEWNLFDADGDFNSVSLQLGEGYYLALLSSQTLYAYGDVVTSNNIEDAEIALLKGWNLISHPLVTDVSKYSITINFNGGTHDWHFATNYGYISPYVYTWDVNQFVQSYELSRWGGYWVHTPNENLTLNIRPDSETEARDATDDYSVRIYARDHNGKAASDMVTVTVDTEADDGFVYGRDEYNLDAHVNPSYIDMYIDRSEWIGEVDHNGVEAESGYFSRVTDTKENLNIFNIGAHVNAVEDYVNLSWDINPDIHSDIHLLIAGEYYNIREMVDIQVHEEQLNQMTLYVGDISEQMQATEFRIGTAYPNPFNPSVSVKISLDKESFVNAYIYNVDGQIVDVISEQKMSTGTHELKWNAHHFSSGVYFFSIRSNSNSSTQKLILIK